MLYTAYSPLMKTICTFPCVVGKYQIKIAKDQEVRIEVAYGLIDEFVDEAMHVKS